MEPTPAPTPPPARAPRLPPPLFSWAYLGVCILVFLPHAAMPGPPDHFLLYGPAVAGGEWWRVLTSAVEHISPFHILANGVSIWSFGTALERQIGSVRMLAASVATALTSSAGALGFLVVLSQRRCVGGHLRLAGACPADFGGRARKVSSSGPSSSC